MKHRLLIGVLLLSLFFLGGCDKIPEEIIDLLPSIEIVGDDLIIVEQYTEFVDPGVDIGDYDLEVTVVTDLDINVIGDYTVTYSISYEGITYDGTRTVRVIAPLVPFDFGWVLATASVTTDSIGVTVTYLDTDGLLTNGKGSLYQGTTLIGSYDLISGVNNLNYTGLHSNLDYKFVIEGSYIDSGITVTLNETELNITTAEIITMQFNLTNETTTYNSYTGDIEITYASSNIVTKKAYLYLGDNVVKEVVLNDTDTTFSASGLLSGTEYVLKVIYTATPSGGGADEEVTEVLKTFSTNTLTAPTFVLLLCEVGFTSAECVVGVETTGFTIESLRVEVWKDGAYDSLHQVTSLNTYVNITDLDQGTEYNLKLYVDYKIAGSEDVIEYTLLKEQTITTNEVVTYTTPSITNMEITKVVGTTNSITFEFDALDPDSVIFDKLYLRFNRSSSGVVREVNVGHNVVTFSGYPIYENAAYTLKFTADYKEDQDTDVWGKEFYEEAVLMPPNVSVTSLAQQKSMYFHSDQIILILEIDNYNNNSDDDQIIEYVTVNGIKIYKEDFLFPSNLHTVYLNMGVETDYTDYSYHMTNVAVTMIDDSSYVIDYDQTISFRLQQPGDIDPVDSEVSVLEITTDDYTKHVSDGVTNYTNITIRLENEYDLDVYSIKLGSEVYLASQFEAGSTSKQIILRVEIDRNYSSFYISGLVYVRNDVNIVAPNTNYNVEHVSIYGYYTEDVVYINTPAELNTIDLTENKYYKLTQDLDLTGFPMLPIGTDSTPFTGVFDGNGFTISNYSYTSYETDQGNNVYLGLFGKSYGFLYNIKIYNSDITVYTNENHYLYVGVLAGNSNGKVIDCTTIGDNTITITGMTQGTVGGLIGKSTGFLRDASADTDITIDGQDIDRDLGMAYNTYVGGLIGIAGSDNIETSSAKGTITITNTVNNTNNVGGLIGQFLNSTSYYATRNFISYSYSSVDIYTSNQGDGTVGGLVGKVNNEYAKNTEIRNSYATGDIYSDRGDIGGLIGESWAYITNSFATGSISKNGGSAYLLAESGYDNFLTNNYVYDGQTVTSSGSPGYIRDDYEGGRVTASVDEYNDEWFYTEVLNWSTYFWDFDTLIVTADIMPEHN